MVDFKKIENMINSKNGDTVYLAAKMLSSNIYNGDSKIKELLNSIPLTKRIKNYSDVCKELNISELTIENFNFLPIDEQEEALAFHKIKNIEKLFNGTWKINWKDSSQLKHYPWFEQKQSGLVFLGSAYSQGSSDGAVAYFKDEETATYIGKTFINLYKILIKG